MNQNISNINKLLNDFLQSGMHQQIGTQFTKSKIDCNLVKLDDAYLYEFAIVGKSKKDISIKLEKNHLVVAVQAEGQDQETPKPIKLEYDYSNSSRRIPLADNADVNTIKAAYKNGILSVHIMVNKSMEGNSGSIEIK